MIESAVPRVLMPLIESTQLSALAATLCSGAKNHESAQSAECSPILHATDGVHTTIPRAIRGTNARGLPQIVRQFMDIPFDRLRSGHPELALHPAFRIDKDDYPSSYYFPNYDTSGGLDGSGIALVGKPVDGRNALLDGADGAAISVAFAADPGVVLPDAPGIAFDQMVALLIVPSVMEGALEKVPPEFPSAGRSIAEQLRSWWWKFVGEGAELAKVKHGWDITTVTSGRDDVEAKEVRDVLSEFTPIHGYSGSLIPGIVECFQYGRVDRIFLAIVPSHLAALLSAVAHGYGGVATRAFPLVEGGVEVVPRPRKPRRGPTLNAPAESSLPTAVSIEPKPETPKTKLRLVGAEPRVRYGFRDFIAGDYVLAMTGIHGSAPIPPIVRRGPHLIELTTVCVCSATRDVWTVSRCLDTSAFRVDLAEGKLRTRLSGGECHWANFCNYVIEQLNTKRRGPDQRRPSKAGAREHDGKSEAPPVKHS